MSERQEWFDRYYFEHGPCCAGCDWWQHHNSRIGECRKSAPVDGAARWELLGITRISAQKLPAGHIMTAYDHACVEFKDGFDWSSLPLSYLKRIGAPPALIASHQDREG